MKFGFYCATLDDGSLIAYFSDDRTDYVVADALTIEELRTKIDFVAESIRHVGQTYVPKALGRAHAPSLLRKGHLQ